jgi:hypothetical protein
MPATRATSRKVAETEQLRDRCAVPSCQIGSRLTHYGLAARPAAPPSMLNSPKVIALRENLAHISAISTTSRQKAGEKELRELVCSVVDELKAAGWPPERSIIAIKEIAQEVGLTQSQGVLVRDRDLTPRDALLATLVRWTIECYYDTSRVA